MITERDFVIFMIGGLSTSMESMDNSRRTRILTSICKDVGFDREEAGKLVEALGKQSKWFYDKMGKKKEWID